MIKTKYLLLLILVLFSLADSLNITWQLGTTYGTMRATVRETIEWNYADPHNIEELKDKASFDACNLDGSTFIAGHVGGGVGTLVNKFLMTPSAGTHYYACSVGTHCRQGMKVEIIVASSTVTSSVSSTETVSESSVTETSTETSTESVSESSATETSTETSTESSTETVSESSATETSTETSTESSTESSTMSESSATETSTESSTETVSESSATDTETSTESSTMSESSATETSTETSTESSTMSESSATDTETSTESSTMSESSATETSTESSTMSESSATETSSVSQSQSATESTISSSETKSTTCSNTGTCHQETYPTASALSEEQLNSSCVFGTYLFNGHCACWSGAYGKDCKMGEEAVCGKVIAKFWDLQGDLQTNCYPYGELDATNDNRDFCMDITGNGNCSGTWGVVQPLNTLSPPQMDSATFETNNLKIIISQPMVNGRADGAAYLNDNKLTKTYPFCTYPVSEYIFKEVDNCRDIWRFEIPWNLASTCGWNIVTQEGYKVYKGQVIIHNHEYLSNIHDCRFIQSVLRIQLRFQLFVEVNLTSVVYNQPNIQSAITQQIVSLQLGEDACLQITTTINYPYELIDGDLILTPPGKFESHTFSAVSKTCSGTDLCRQRWKSCLALVNGTCDLDGAYKMNFTKECRSNNQNCPLAATEKVATIDFTLDSENFCAEISVDIGLYGTIQSYSDETFVTIKTTFIVGVRACFLVVVNSDSNPTPYNATSASIKLLSTKLYTVSVRVGSDAIIKLFTAGTVSDTLYGTQIKEIDEVAGNKVGFCYYFTQKLVEGLNCTGIVNIVTGAEVKVSYDNGSSQKRATTKTDTTTLSSSSTLDTTQNNDHNVGSVIFVSLVLIFFVLFFF